jgi:broad-specificity NMP kinase
MRGESVPLFYITGVSGTGKSSILHELRARRFDAYGVDEDVYAKWVDRKTGCAVAFPGWHTVDMHEWYRDHMWVMDADAVNALQDMADAEKNDVFLCGGTAGEEAVWHRFTRVFALVVDVDTLQQRIAQRTGNSFGKTPEELREILDWHKVSEETYRNVGATLIDATRPLEAVVDDILRHITVGTCRRAAS